MTLSPDYDSYAEKMRAHSLGDTDMDVVSRFVDMLCPRQSRIIDIGCGVGHDVNALRRLGHDAYGVDPTPQVMQVAGELFDAGWFRQLAARKLRSASFRAHGLPDKYEAVLLAGNVPAFLSPEELRHVFDLADQTLSDSGVLIVGTTSKAVGGPEDQDMILGDTSLELMQRFADWHLTPYRSGSPWSVSVYSRTAQRPGFPRPDGTFILPT